VALRRRRGPRSVPRPESLHDAILRLAECPCEAHRTAFLELFAEADELLFVVAEADRPITGGEHRRVGPDDRLALATVTTGAEPLLLAFPDQATALRHDREAPYAGLGVREAARLVLEDPSLGGILVSAADETSAWATVTRHHLATLVTPEG